MKLIKKTISLKKIIFTVIDCQEIADHAMLLITL